MKNKPVLMLIVLLLMLLPVNGAMSQASDPAKPSDFAPEQVESNVSLDAMGETSQDANSVQMLLAQAPYTMNYQGYLTSNTGQPISGSYDLTFKLYDAEMGGTLVWGPETHTGVSVSRGLFSVILGKTITLLPAYFNRALFLEVAVNGTLLTGRQPLRSSAYAFGLVPGAEVSGVPQGTNYALTVDNTDAVAGKRGLYVGGWEYGIFAEETGPGDVGIYTPDFVKALGYKSESDSYLWIPAIAGIPYLSGALNSKPNYEGSVELSTAATGSYSFLIPINTPAMLMGQEVKVEELTITYRTTNSASYITDTNLMRQSLPMNKEYLIMDTSDRNSTTDTSYNLYPSVNNVLSANAGPLTLQIVVNLTNTAHKIIIGGVRLRLGHLD